MPICIKYQDENNNILRVETSELTIGGVQNINQLPFGKMAALYMS